MRARGRNVRRRSYGVTGAICAFGLEPSTPPSRVGPLLRGTSTVLGLRINYIYIDRRLHVQWPRSIKSEEAARAYDVIEQSQRFPANSV